MVRNVAKLVGPPRYVPTERTTWTAAEVQGLLGEVQVGAQRRASAVIAVHPHRAPVSVRDPHGLNGELAELLDPNT